MSNTTETRRTKPTTAQAYFDQQIARATAAMIEIQAKLDGYKAMTCVTDWGFGGDVEYISNQLADLAIRS